MRLGDLSHTLSVLADPVRLRILHLLFVSEAGQFDVTALVSFLQLPQPTVSKHLAILRAEGLIRAQKLGRRRLYAQVEPQTPLHAALLAALESFVASAPKAREDLRRAAEAAEEGLTVGHQATYRLPIMRAGEREPEAVQEETDAVLHAMQAHTRRRLVDVISSRPGCTLSDLLTSVDISRQALRKHVSALEAAGLVHVERDGRRRRLYYNAMPLQLLYNRFTDAESQRLAVRVARVKQAVERGERR